MKRIATTGLCLVSTLVTGMALTGSAAAVELLWLVCLKGTGLTKYKNEKCLEASGAGNGTEGWQSVGVPAGRSITVELLPITVVLRDTSVLGNRTVICSSKGSKGRALIEPGGTAEILELFWENPKENCKGAGACNGGVEGVTAIHLPWVAKIVEGPNGKPLTKPEATEAGPPGWSLKCEGNFDICEIESGFPEEIELLNAITTNQAGVKELLVKGVFQGKNKTKCSRSAEKAKGEVTGLFALLLPGGALSIAD